jgi:hypothetical protein
MSGARFSIIPAWIVTDQRLKGSDLRVLCLLGTHTNKEGWCRRSQIKMSQQLKCGRSTVQDSLNRLSDIGAVEKRPVESADGRDSAHWYRVVLDRTVSSNAFSAWEGEEDEEFSPISDAENTTPPAGIPAPPAGPEAAPPAGPEPAPINDHSLTVTSNDRERARTRTDRDGDGNENPKAVMRAFNRWYGDWPTRKVDSTNAAEQAWLALSAEQRAECIAKTPLYVERANAVRGVKVPYASVYLNGRDWEKLDDPKSDIAPPAVRGPFTRPWHALRLFELLQPMASAIPGPTATQRAVMAQGGEAARRVMQERQQRYGWPKVNMIDERAGDHKGMIVSPQLLRISEDFGKVRTGGLVEAAWKRLHERRGWRWLPSAPGIEWLWLPAIDDEAVDLDEAVERAITDFERQANEGRTDDAA